MKIAIVHSKSGKSSKMLSEALTKAGHKVSIHKPFVDGDKGDGSIDLCIRLGCSAYFKSKRSLNSLAGVLSCISKVSTFTIMREAGVRTVNWCTRWKDIPEEWDTIVARKTAEGSGNDGFDFYYSKEETPKNCELYTEYCFAPREYRVMYICGDVLVYLKKRDKEDNWEFVQVPTNNYPEFIAQSSKAALAIGMDYVGFDVLAYKKSEPIFLEANSGATLTKEACDILVKYVGGM